MSKLQNSYLVDNDQYDYWLNLEERWDIAVLNKIYGTQNLTKDQIFEKLQLINQIKRGK